MATDQFQPEHLEQFNRDGFFVARGLIDDVFCSQLRSVVDDHLARDAGSIEYEAELQYPGAPTSLESEGGRTARRLKQAISRDAIFTDLVMKPELTARLRQLLGPQIAMPLSHHNCIMTKQPGYSSDTGWHQDVRYWSYEQPELVSVWLALGDETVANGCLQVIPQTHRNTPDRERLDGELFLREDIETNQELIAGKQFVELSCGDVLFFHCRTFHSATRNRADRTKYSVVFTFRPVDNRPLPDTRSSSLPDLLIP